MLLDTTQPKYVYHLHEHLSFSRTETNITVPHLVGEEDLHPLTSTTVSLMGNEALFQAFFRTTSVGVDN